MPQGQIQLTNKIVLVSGCLLGFSCRYDGKSCRDKNLIKLISDRIAVPFCPEQLGGLPTPRIPANIVKGNGRDVINGKAKVVNGDGVDVTIQFIRGAKETLKIVKSLKIKEAYMKTNSPSCGAENHPLKYFSNEGVTAALLRSKGIKIIPVQGGR
ncbi:MAG: DUF523 domain-containing protein [Planctomycetota bacterium]